MRLSHRQKRTVYTLLVFLALAGARQMMADIVTITDPYQGQNNSGAGPASLASDVIGAYSEFDVDRIIFTSLSSNNISAQIRFNHSVQGQPSLADLALHSYFFSPYTLPVADLLFDVNGTYTFGVPLVSHDGLVAGSLYQMLSVRTSNDYLSGSGYFWRFNTPVTINPIGATLLNAGAAPVTTGLGYAEVQTTISFTPNAGFWNDLTGPGLSVHFASAVCANDVLDGNIHATPEPGAIILFGTSLLLIVPILRRQLGAKRSQSSEDKA